MIQPPLSLRRTFPAVFLLLACTGSTAVPTGGGTGGPCCDMTGGAGGAGGKPVMPPTDPDLAPLADQKTVPGSAPLRRLTLREYNNTVRDLLGLDVAPASVTKGFSPDSNSSNSGFAVGSAITVSEDVRTFLLTGEQLAQMVTAKLESLVPCAPLPSERAAQDTCADQFITGFGGRAFRRPLAASEREKLRALYDQQRKGEGQATFAEAIGDLVTAMLEAPQFLYRWELGPSGPRRDGSLVLFDDFELASRLSYLFWASMPDDELFAEAAAGRLSSTASLVKQARRLLADPRAREAVKDFHAQWLELDWLEQVSKDSSYVAFTPELVRSMRAENEAFVTDLFFGTGAKGQLETLLTSPSTFVDAGLAKLYGVDPPATAGLQPVALDGKQRAGVFTQAAFLTSKADPEDGNPVKRGMALFQRLLCLELRPPDNLIIPPLPEPTPGTTTRERFEMLDNNPCATACHSMIDPLGLSFENYDAIGAYRTIEQGKPVDAHGSVKLSSGDDFSFTNAVDLMGKLATNDHVRECMSTQWLRYFLRRHEISSEEPSLTALVDVFRKKGFDMRELMVAMTRTRTFTHRSPSPGEVTR
jgi:hypothetical protein